MTIKLPQMPAPASLGGGMIPVYVRRGQRPGLCTVPRCTAFGATKCGFVLLNGSGKTCGAKVCAKHAKDGLCPSHRRLIEQRGGRAAP